MRGLGAIHDQARLASLLWAVREWFLPEFLNLELQNVKLWHQCEEKGNELPERVRRGFAPSQAFFPFLKYHRR